MSAPGIPEPLSPDVAPVLVGTAVSGSSPNAAQARQAAMRFILITVLIDMISIGLIVPVLPHIVGTFTSSPTEQTWWFGAVAIAFSLANFFGSPVIGAMSDRYGRRPVLLVGFCGLGLSFFVTATATALWMLIVVRMFSGAMQSNISVANAYVADITPPEHRAQRFGLLGAMFGVGFILGPTAGGLLGAIDVHLPFFVAGGMAIVNLLYGYFVLPESLPLDKRRPFSWKRVNPIASFVGLSRLKGVGPLVFVVALSSLAQFVLHTSWVLYTNFKFGWGPAQVGWSLLAVGVMSVLTQGFLLKHLLKRFSPAKLGMLGLGSSAVAYFAFGAATEGWMMYVIIACNLFGGSAAAAFQSMISNAADAKQQGETMGAVSAMNSLMAAMAPLVATPLLGIVSHHPAGHWQMGLPFYFCSALQASGAVVAYVYFRSQSRLRAAAA